MSVAGKSMGTGRRYFGVVEAIVVDNLDPEKEGRVRLRYPWFDEQTVSQWCRVGQFYAGPGQKGAFFVPELDSEVLVAFIHGDMRHPIVIGSLYNGVDKPAVAREDSTDEKQLRTRSGHTITLVDTQGEEKILIADKSGKHMLEFNTAENGVTVRSDGGKLTLAAKEIEITADTSLKINADKIVQEATSSYKTTTASYDATASGEMNLAGSTINLN